MRRPNERSKWSTVRGVARLSVHWKYIVLQILGSIVLSATVMSLVTLVYFSFFHEGTVNSPFYDISSVLSSLNFQNSAALVTEFAVISLIFFDVISIVLRKIGAEYTCQEFALYTGTDGTQGPKLTRADKLLVVYPLVVFVLLTMAILQISENYA
jgi:hypothetical protein